MALKRARYFDRRDPFARRGLFGISVLSGGGYKKDAPVIGAPCAEGGYPDTSFLALFSGYIITQVKYDIT